MTTGPRPRKRSGLGPNLAHCGYCSSLVDFGIVKLIVDDAAKSFRRPFALTPGRIVLKVEYLEHIAEATGGGFSETVAADTQRAGRKDWVAAEKLLFDGIQAIRTHAKAYSDDPGRTMEETQRFVVERVRERPVTAALAALGVGFLLGMLLSGRGK